MLKPGCKSCDILTGKITSPGGTIYENEYWHVDSVTRPVVWKGFLIVKLKRHCEQIAELTTDEAALLGPTLHKSCQALADVLHPAKVYVCSFGEGVRHIHFWILPRPVEMRPGMHPTIFSLDIRQALTRHFHVRRWIVPDVDLEAMATQLRSHAAFMD